MTSLGPGPWTGKCPSRHYRACHSKANRALKSPLPRLPKGIFSGTLQMLNRLSVALRVHGYDLFLLLLQYFRLEHLPGLYVTSLFSHFCFSGCSERCESCLARALVGVNFCLIFFVSIHTTDYLVLCPYPTFL